MNIDDPRSDSLPESLLKSITLDGGADALVDLSDAALENLSHDILHNHMLEKIPVIGVAVGVAKGALGIRDRLYIRKLLSFLSETAKSTAEERQKFADKINSSPGAQKRASIAVLEVLDRITSAEKSKLVGKLFRAYMVENEINVTTLQYLVEMIDKAYLSDLKGLAGGTMPNFYNLVNVGIMNAVPAELVMQRLQEHNDRSWELALHGMTPPGLPPLTKQAGLTDAGKLLARILRDY